MKLKSKRETLVKTAQWLLHRIGPSHDQAFVRITVRSRLAKKGERERERVWLNIRNPSTDCFAQSLQSFFFFPENPKVLI